MSLIDDHLVIAGSPLKSLVSADEGVSFTEVTPLQDIVQAEQAYILPDQHFWSINGRQILRSRTPAKNSDGSRQSLQFASLNFPESFGSLHKVLGFSKTQLFLEFTGDRFVVINYVSDDSPNNGELQASNLSLLPAFVSIQAPNLAAGALPENRGYWILRGPYMASLLRSDADPLKPFTWQLYDNHIEITDSKPLTHMALKPILIEGEWSASGRVFGITADSLLKSALPAEITPNFAKHIKPISVRACEVCHDSSTALDTEERWLAHRDSIVDRISRPKDSPGRMPPQGAKGFTPDDRDLILEFLK